MGTTTARSKVQVPAFFDPKNAADFNYNPDAAKIFAEATAFRKASGLKLVGASVGAPRVHVLGIDLQRDFCFPQGTLYVGGRSGKGAIEDSVRFTRFLYANAGRISDFTATLDTHLPMQIFFQTFWNNVDNTPVAAFRFITVDQIRKHEVVPNPAMAYVMGCTYPWLLRQVEFYCSELEKAGKYQLYIWPFHCLLGSVGHTLVGVVDEARLFLMFSRGFQNVPEIKGHWPMTENYSVFSPEVTATYDGSRTYGQKNAHLIETIAKADVVVMAGQAGSHCVKSSIDDFLLHIKSKDADMLRKVYILRDCMSAVVVPGVIDCTDDAEKALARFSSEGMHVVESTTPMEEWPGIDSRIAS